MTVQVENVVGLGYFPDFLNKDEHDFFSAIFCLKGNTLMADFENEEYYFNFSASLRIFGEIEDLEQITHTLELTPTHIHKKGDKFALGNYEHDMWSYTVPIEREHLLDTHIAALWKRIKPHKQFLLELKKHLTVDVLCGYRSNSATAGFKVSYQALEMFIELEIPFDVSVVVSSNELHRALKAAKNNSN